MLAHSGAFPKIFLLSKDLFGILNIIGSVQVAALLRTGHVLIIINGAYDAIYKSEFRLTSYMFSKLHHQQPIQLQNVFE